MQTEQALIGGLLKKPDMLVEIIGNVNPSDFQNKNAGYAYRSICDLWQQGKHVDLITVSAAAGRAVDAVWLAESTDIGFSSAVSQYTEIVSEKAKKVRLQKSLREIASDNFSETGDILSKIARLHDQETGRSCKDVEINSVVRRFGDAVEQNRKSGSLGFFTGFEFLTEKYITYCPAHVWVVGAFTSVGKTALVTEMLARLYILSNPRVAIVSTEMTETQMVARYLANKTGFSSNVILSGRIHERNRKALDQEKDALGQKNLFVFDDIFEISEIEAALRKVQLQGGLDVVFLDYLQNCRVAGAKSEYAEMSELAKRIQRLAKKLGTTIVCLSQVSNGAAKDDNGILQFKGAGEFAAVADIGIMLKKNKQNKAQILCEIRKNRHGQLGKQVLQYQDNWTRLEEISHDENE